jgi:cytochrome c-type biogenesis protein
MLGHKLIRTLTLALTLTLGLGALAACGNAFPSYGEVGDKAPEYGATTLSGDSITLASLRGSPVLLNIWATWCPPCRKEMPDLQELHERYSPQGLRVVGISIDAAGADDMVRNFLTEYDVTYTILRDPGDRIASVFMTQGVPVTILIDSDGTVLWRRLGPVSAKDEGLTAALQRALL